MSPRLANVSETGSAPPRGLSETGGGRALATERRSAARRLALAYEQGGIPGLHQEYLALAEERPSCRVLWRIVDIACPVSGFLAWTVRLDQLIDEAGYCRAAAQAFDDLSLPVEVKLPAGAEGILRRAPLLVYGNHPSMITSLVVAAALGRSDLRFFSVQFFAKILPASAPFILPFWDTHARTWRDFVGSGLTHTLALSLLFRLAGQERRPDARAHNREMLNAAAGHVRGGGSVLLFPMGGGTRWRDWFPGVGVLAQELARVQSARPVYLAPFYVENESNARLYSLLAARGPARARRERLNGEPIRIRFDEPRQAREVVPDPSSSAAATARALQEEYHLRFPEARDAA